MNLVERTAALVPMLRQHAAAAERERRVPVETLGALDQAGVFRMMAPKRFGGDEASFETQCRVLAEIARGCPSTSWVATIYSAMAWTASVFPDRAQDEIFAGGVPRIAGVFSPTGTAVCKDDGFIVTGAGRTTRMPRGPVDAGGGARDAGRRRPVRTHPRPKPRADHPRRLVRERHGRHGQQHRRRRAVRPCPSRAAAAGHGRRPLPERHNSGNPTSTTRWLQFLVVNGAERRSASPVARSRRSSIGFRAAASCTPRNMDKSAAPVTHLQVGEASLKIDSAIAHVQRATATLDGLQGGALTVQDRVCVARAHRLRDGPGTRGR